MRTKHPVATKKAIVKMVRKRTEVLPSSVVADIRQLAVSARQTAYSAVSMVRLDAYWKIGRRIVEEEQNGRRRAGYGERLIETLSEALTAEFGKGYSERNRRLLISRTSGAEILKGTQ